MKHTKQHLEDRLEALKEKEQVSEENYQSLKKFYKRLRLSDSVGNERIYKYLSALHSLFDTPDSKSSKNFIPEGLTLEKAEKEDIREVVFRIQESSYSQWSRNDFKVLLKKFYNTVYEDEIDRPDRVKKILRADFLKKDTNIENQREIKALTASEIKQMSEQASNPRDSLLPVFMFETGARIGEITGRNVSDSSYEGVRLKDVDLNQKFAEVRIETEKNEKNDRKTLTLVRSVGLLQDWLENHPNQGDPQAKLFQTIARNNTGSDLGPARIKEVLRELAQEADIDKPITNHVFRHSSATYKATELNFNQQRLMYWHGWKDEKMASKYTHQDEDRMRAQRLEEEGIEDAENRKDDALEIKECPRCGESVDPFASYCPNCSLALDQQTAQKAKNETGKAMDQVIDEIRQEAGLTEADIKELIREKTKEAQQDEQH